MSVDDDELLLLELARVLALERSPDERVALARRVLLDGHLESRAMARAWRDKHIRRYVAEHCTNVRGTMAKCRVFLRDLDVYRHSAAFRERSGQLPPDGLDERRRLLHLLLVAGGPLPASADQIRRINIGPRRREIASQPSRCNANRRTPNNGTLP